MWRNIYVVRCAADRMAALVAIAMTEPPAAQQRQRIVSAMPQLQVLGAGSELGATLEQAIQTGRGWCGCAVTHVSGPNCYPFDSYLRTLYVRKRSIWPDLYFPPAHTPPGN